MIKKILMGVMIAIITTSTYADDKCAGLHVSSEIDASKISSNELVNYEKAISSLVDLKDAKEALVNGGDLKGKLKNISIKTSVLVSADTCEIVKVAGDSVRVVKLTNAILKNVDVAIYRASDPKQTSIDPIHTSDVTLSGVSLIATVIPSVDQKNDPLQLNGSTKVVPKTTINTLSGSAIPAYTELHYVDGVNGIYTFFTEGDPCSKFSIFGKHLGRCNEAIFLAQDKTFVVAAEQLKNRVVVSRWTTGLLVVPYKYGLANHSLAQGSISIGPYAGYTVDWAGSEWTFPITAGIAKVSVPSLQNGVATTTEKAGLSIATGVLFNPGGLIKTGILLGVDQLGSNSGYNDNGKLWLGVYVGAGF
jgi:hypothetical protein